MSAFFLKHLFRPGFVVRCGPWIQTAGGVGLVLVLVATLQGLFFTPPDAVQGEWVRLLYIHVPCSWMALALYGALGLSSALHLAFRMPVARWVAQGCGQTGLVMACCSVFTGMIWGRPTWGTWWAWDARLTSMALLVLLYVGFVSLETRHKALDSSQTGSILGLLGLVNLPLIKGSVTWWATLHQPPSIVLSAAGVSSAIDPVFLPPLALMTIGLGLVSTWSVYSTTLDRLALRKILTYKKYEK